MKKLIIKSKTVVDLLSDLGGRDNPLQKSNSKKKMVLLIKRRTA